MTTIVIDYQPPQNFYRSVSGAYRAPGFFLAKRDAGFFVARHDDWIAPSIGVDHLRQAIADAFAPSAWRGGPAIVYVTSNEDELCGACARLDFLENARRIPGLGRMQGCAATGCVVSESDHDITCAACGKLIVAQNLCPDHGYQPDAICGEDAGTYVCPVCHPDDFCAACRTPLRNGMASGHDGLCAFCDDERTSGGDETSPERVNRRIARQGDAARRIANGDIVARWTPDDGWRVPAATRRR